jgi:hypothetical protein
MNSIALLPCESSTWCIYRLICGLVAVREVEKEPKGIGRGVCHKYTGRPGWIRHFIKGTFGTVQKHNSPRLARVNFSTL